MDAMTSEALASHMNMVEAFELLTEHLENGAVDRHGSVLSIFTGSRLPMFNLICATDRPAEAADVQEAASRLSAAGCRWTAKFPSPRDDEVLRTLTDLGCLETEGEPAMILDELPTETQSPAGVTIRRMEGPRGYESFISGLASANGAPDSIFRSYLGPGLMQDARVDLFLAETEGQSVGHAISIATGSTVGIFNVGVAESHRRRGIGWALTATGLERGRQLGCTTGSLQASPMGLPVYAAHGFRTVFDYRQFESPPASS